jgi:hypothetical protein
MSAHPALIATLRRRFGVFAWSRLVLIVVLLLGQVLTPAVATQCDVGDAIAAVDAMHADDDRDVVAAMADTDSSDRSDCCDGGCVDCCLHASPVLSSPLRFPNLAFATLIPLPRTTTVAPGDYPVDIRPPIAR